jgi:protein-tyrosine phosphatase
MMWTLAALTACAGGVALKTETSITSPIRVDMLGRDVTGLPGRIGMTFAPGKKDVGIEARWDRDLATDLDAIRAAGGQTLVSLIEPREFELLEIPDLPRRAEEAGLRWEGFPIRDGWVPESMPAFLALADRLLDEVAAGRTVVLHCRGGLGRTGLLAATMLVRLGRSPRDAAVAVRAARPGTLETAAQVRYLDDVAVAAGTKRATDR